MSKLGAEPSRFTVNYKGGSKKEERRLSFVDGAVDEVFDRAEKAAQSAHRAHRHRPARARARPADGRFLVGPFQRVLPGPLDVCQQTVPVFDGKQRFDIVLSPKRLESTNAEAPAGLSGPMPVCRVKFVPISGYRPDHPGIKFMAQTDEIEVWLFPLARTNLYFPYRIAVPTTWGSEVSSLPARSRCVPEPERHSLG